MLNDIQFRIYLSFFRRKISLCYAQDSEIQHHELPTHGHSAQPQKACKFAIIGYRSL